MSYDQAPPPEDTAPGYKPDPLGSTKRLREWNGERWTGNTRTADGKGMSSNLKWLIGIGIGAIVIIALATGQGEEDSPDTKTGSSAPPLQAVDTGPVSNPKPKPKPEPALTPGQENALDAASNYLSYTNFSRSGLIEQLVFEGYPKKDAEFAVDLSFVDWKKQAYGAAKNYLSYTSFSLSGLIDQLVFEGYTQAQAEYGATKAYNGG